MELFGKNFANPSGNARIRALDASTTYFTVSFSANPSEHFLYLGLAKYLSRKLGFRMNSDCFIGQELALRKFCRICIDASKGDI